MRIMFRHQQGMSCPHCHLVFRGFRPQRWSRDADCETTRNRNGNRV